MITPPLFTKAYYIVHLKNEVAEAAVSNLFSNANYILNVMVLSKDQTSDVEATNELQLAVSKLINDAELNVDPIIKFNPMYLPHDEDIQDIEVNFDGDVIGIGGFPNPYISASILANKNGVQLIEGKVCFESFDLPSIEQALKGVEHRLN